MNLGVDSSEKYYWKPNLIGIEKELGNLRNFLAPGPQFKGKTLFIGGSLSNYIKIDYHPTIHKFFPNSEIVTVEGAGHWVHSQKPQEVINLILKVLSPNE
jgi:pimeloyl-ACP methyl ester carboxylesterase